MKLWVDQFRPTTISEYVFKNKNQQKLVEQWIKEGGIPHLLFHGGPGTGKTTLAKVLINDLKVHNMDFMFIDASRDNGVDVIKNHITRFSETMPFGDFKVILMDEADYLSPNAYAALRGAINNYASTVRFILTANYAHRIPEPIHSRIQSFHITNQDLVDFTEKLAEILIQTNTKFTLETLDSYVRATYPDMRKTINNLQKSTSNGELTPIDNVDISESDWKISMVGLFQQGKLRDARTLICSNVTPDEYEDIYRFLYRNLDFFSENVDQEDEAIIIIRNGLWKHGQVADPEINLSATLIELANIKK